jgi:hypothetical protein
MSQTATRKTRPRDIQALFCRRRHQPKRVADGTLTTRRGALGASCSQQRPAHYVSGQIGLRHKASRTARVASARNLYQGGVQAMALHVAHDMSSRS